MNDENKTNVIKKKRAIVSILSELGLTKCRIMLLSDSISYDCRIKCKYERDFNNITFTVNDVPTKIKKGKATCCYAEHRLTFDVSRNDQGEWELPSHIEILELRKNKRWTFPERQYSVEIVGKYGSCYGHAVDINSDYIAVDMDSDFELEVDSSYKIIVRMVSKNTDVIYCDTKLSLLKQSENEYYRGIFFLSPVSKKQDLQDRLGKRFSIKNTSLFLYGSPLNDFRDELSFMVDNISSGGIRISIRSGNQKYKLLPGMIMRSDNPKLIFIVVWVNNQSFGLRPLLNGSFEVTEWYRYINQINPPIKEEDSISRREFASLITHSGLLKEERRLPFGEEIDRHLMTDLDINFPLIVQKIYETSVNKRVNLHIGARRLSEKTWFFSEGVAIDVEAGKYATAVEKLTKRLRQLSHESLYFPSYLTAMWHKKIKSSAAWGESHRGSKYGKFFKAKNISKKNILEKYDDSGSNSGIDIISLSNLSASERRSLFLEYSPELIESLVGADGSHHIFNSELNKFGPYHHALSFCLNIGGTKSLVGHRLKTYQIWSNTGVTNSMFVLIPRGYSETDLRKSLYSLSNSDEAIGTDDFLLIFEEDVDYLVDNESRSLGFNYLVIDLKRMKLDLD